MHLHDIADIVARRLWEDKNEDLRQRSMLKGWEWKPTWETMDPERKEDKRRQVIQAVRYTLETIGYDRD